MLHAVWSHLMHIVVSFNAIDPLMARSPALVCNRAYDVF